MTGKFHRIYGLVVDLYFEPFGKSVGNRRAYAVQAARKTVVFVIEFAARVKLGEYYLYARNTRLFVYIRGDTPAVIFYRNAAVLIQHDLDVVGETVCRLVHGVVNYFP